MERKRNRLGEKPLEGKKKQKNREKVGRSKDRFVIRERIFFVGDGRKEKEEKGHVLGGKRKRKGSGKGRVMEGKK